MTARNVKTTPAARKALVATATESRGRAVDVRKGLEALEHEEDDLEVGYNVAQLSLEDERLELLQEGERLVRAIKREAPAPSNAADSTTSVDTATLPLAPASGESTHVDHPTGEVPAAVQNQQNQPHIFDVRRWRRSQRVASLIGMLIGVVIGLIVGLTTYKPILHLAGAYHHHNMVYAWAPAVAIPWIIFMVCAFISLGALTGILMEGWLRQDPDD